MPFLARNECLQRFQACLANNHPLIAAGAGNGLAAKSAEAGGVDLLVIYNSGRFRQAGLGSLAGMLPFGDANGIVMEMGNEILPIVRQTPVLAGVCGTDPFRLMPVFLRELQGRGFDGVQNFPSVGLFDGQFRVNLEETGLGFEREIDLIATAHRLDMLTCAFVFDADSAKEMVRAGADIIAPHLGVTSSGSVGAHSVPSLDEAAARIQAMRDAAIFIRKDIVVLFHGGPAAEPDDVQYILSHTEGISGFFAASSIERIPVEKAIREQTRIFKDLKLKE